jgi:malic enzyme
LPRPLDKTAHKRVAQAVAKAAMETGIAREDLDEDYFSAN